MKIVIVGDGKVGCALAEQLNDEGHDITIIDNNYQTLNATLESLDVMGIHGNGASHQVQLEAGVPDADLLIAATSSDELNMICCLTAKTNGCKHTIARVRNPEYAPQLQMFKEMFGLSMVINPEYEAAREIARVIGFPPALKIDTFAKGRVELIEFKLSDNNKIVGKRLAELPKTTDTKVLICAVERDGKVIIPDGSFVLQAGDRLHITGQSKDISKFLHTLGGITWKIRSIMIVGGGRLAYYLTKLLDDKSFQIKIIEKKRERCDQLCELLPRVVVIHADGSNLELLESEGIEEVDAFVALTDMDEENLIMSMLAHYKKVQKIITKTAHFNYLSFMERLGIDSVINPKVTTANQICQYVRAMQNSSMHSNITTLYKLVDGKAEAVEFSVNSDTRNLNVSLQEVSLKPSMLVAAIVRRGKVIIPHGQDSIQLGDNIVVVSNGGSLTHVNDIFLEKEPY